MSILESSNDDENGSCSNNPGGRLPAEILHYPRLALCTDKPINEDVKFRALEVGVDYILRKPVQAQDLFKLVSKYGCHVDCQV